MPKPVSIILLAGGKSSRMGRDKARLKVDGGLEMLQAIARKLSAISDEVIVATDGRKYDDIGVPVKWVEDIRPGAGSLMGLYSGLREASRGYALVVACDMPFLNLDLLRYMMNLPRDYLILAPRLGDKTETLHTIYSRKVLPEIARLLEAGHLKITDLFSKVPVCYIPEEAINRYDPEHLSFFNINSPCQLEEARKMLEKG
jgi:molybdopterin-guanine dinucleotide biosynthesis protein A